MALKAVNDELARRGRQADDRHAGQQIVNLPLIERKRRLKAIVLPPVR